MSEFFTALRPYAFSLHRPDGGALWQLMTQVHRDTRIMGPLGLKPEEVLYPFASGRYGVHDVPPIALTTLPHLTDRPDDLLDELEPVVRSWPEDELGRQYMRLFEWLAARFSRSVVVERSGASLEYLADLHRLFPAASVVHIWRDPLACALSMREHSSFRMGRVRARLVREIGFDPYLEDREVDVARVPEALRPLLPESFDLEAYGNYPFSAADFGWHWSALVMGGLPTLKALPARQLHTLTYEELLTRPQRVLTELGHFIGLDDLDHWAAAAAGGIGPRHASRLADLDAEQMADLKRSVSVASRSLLRFNAARGRRTSK